MTNGAQKVGQVSADEHKSEYGEDCDERKDKSVFRETLSFLAVKDEEHGASFRKRRLAFVATIRLGLPGQMTNRPDRRFQNRPLCGSGGQNFGTDTKVTGCARDVDGYPVTETVRGLLNTAEGYLAFSASTAAS